MRRLVLPFVVLAVLAAPAWAPPEAAAQCSMCKAALTGSEEGRAISGDFNLAILVMLFAPYAVVGGLGAILMRRRLGLLLQRALRRGRGAGPAPWPQGPSGRLRLH